MKNIKIKSIVKKIKYQKFIAFLESSFIVKMLVPPKESKEYLKKQIYIKKIGVNKSIEQLMLYKILISLVTLLVLIRADNYYITQKKNDILGNQQVISNSISNYQIKNSQEELLNKVAVKTLALDPNTNKEISSGEIQQVVNNIKRVENKLNIADNDNALAKEVLNKLIKYSNVKSGVVINLLIILVTLLSSRIIDLWLKIKEFIFNAKFEEELKLLEILTITLIKNSSLTVYQILEKQKDYSKLLKKNFIKCLSVYPIDKQKAIDDMIKDVDNKEFTKFMSLIKQNLSTDRTTNIRLLEAEKSRRQTLNNENCNIRIQKISRVFTIMSFPQWAISIAIMLIPIILYVKNNM